MPQHRQVAEVVRVVECGRCFLAQRKSEDLHADLLHARVVLVGCRSSGTVQAQYSLDTSGVSNMQYEITITKTQVTSDALSMMNCRRAGQSFHSTSRRSCVISPPSWTSASPASAVRAR